MTSVSKYTAEQEAQRAALKAHKELREELESATMLLRMLQSDNVLLLRKYQEMAAERDRLYAQVAALESWCRALGGDPVKALERQWEPAYVPKDEA